MAEKKEKQVTFEESLNTSETFFLKNRKMIFGILGAVIVLVVGGILYHSYVSLPREDEASTELAKSEQLMMQQQYDQALKGFQRVAADYGSTDAGNLANLYTALCYAIFRSLTGRRLWSMQRSSARATTRSSVPSRR